MAINILLTGGIGSGKSTCSRIFELLGVPVFYDDVFGREISNTNPDVVDKIKLLFGDDIYSENQLNRKLVGSMVFSNPQLLKALSEIIHPAVQNGYSAWCHRFNLSPYTIRESALATNENNLFDYVIAVTAPLDLRIQRVINRDSLTQNEVIERINRQKSQDELCEFADFTICCDDTTLVIPQIISIHNSILKI